MTEKQLVRAIKRYNISLVFDNITKLWWAGEGYLRDTEDRQDEGENRIFSLKTKYRGSQHCGSYPELAVEDYCAARNLEWDL